MAIFDPIRAVRKLRDNGVPEPQAEATVEVVRDATEAATDGLATKADIAALESRMDARFDLFEARMEARFAEADARMLSAMNRAIGLVIAAMGVIAAIALAIAELT